MPMANHVTGPIRALPSTITSVTLYCKASWFLSSQTETAKHPLMATPVVPDTTYTARGREWLVYTGRGED